MTVTPAVPDLPESTAYSSPVPREFVHKSAHTEVLLTGWKQLGEREFEVGAQWPRDHGYWRTGRGGVQDPMLLVETTRQVLPLLSHAAYRVPPDHQLIWDHHHCAFAAPLLRVTDRPAEVVLRLSVSHPPLPGGRLRRLAVKMTVTGEGRTLGTASTVFSAHSPEVYARLRGSRTRPPSEAMSAALPPPAPVVPALVARESEREVVLAPAGDESRRQLRVVTSSPWLFDHPVDHAPGMLLMEAARQCAHLVLQGRQSRLLHLVRMEAEFTRYVDLDEPAWVDWSEPSADGDSSGGAKEETLTVGITQRGVQAFTAVVGFASAAVLPGDGGTAGSEVR